MHGYSPQDELDQQKALTAKYKQDLSRTLQENRELHVMIAKMKKHFSSYRGLTGCYEYDNVSEPDDRDLFLQAHIATATAQALFSHEARLFGLDERTGRHLAAFEELLQDSHVPREEIKHWRIQTIKAAGKITNKHLDNQPIKAPRELLEQLKQVHTQVSSHADWPSAEHALDKLFQSAHDLALTIRSCKAEFEWKQTVPPALLNEPDINHIDGYYAPLNEPDFTNIDGYNVGEARGVTGRPVKILFGPVYKRVDGKLVMLRNGTVLFN